MPPPPDASGPLDRAAAIALALVLIAAVAIHLPRLAAPLFAYDFVLLDPLRGGPFAPVEHGGPHHFVGRQLYFGALRAVLGESPVAYRVAGLSLFVALLALLFALARRLAGTGAAVIAAAIVAVHYAAEVPASWIAASEVTLAAALAVLALLLHVRGFRGPAAAAFALAAFTRGDVLVTPFVALFVARRPGEPFARALLRAWPLLVVSAAWCVVRAGSLGAGDAGAAAGAAARGVLPALVHLPQVVAGFEWRQGTTLDLGRATPGALSVALVLVAVFVARRTPHGAAPAPSPAAIPTGIAWALLAALPASGAASHWSAHHYLFAVCGAALALGAWLARRAPVEALVAVALLGLGSASARGLDEFAGVESAWTGRSHVNRHYIDRATDQSRRYLESLRRARPTLPARATLFIDGVRPIVGFQSGDGPRIRRAYGDTTLRSYDVAGFSLERAARGPLLLFLAAGDSLAEVPAREQPLRVIAISLLLAERPEQARDALALAREREGAEPRRDYLLAWTEWSLGRRDRASLLFEELGLRPDDARAPDRAAVMAALAAADTATASEQARAGVALSALDPDRHALLADLLLMRDPDGEDGLVEGWIARVLAPEATSAWRRWAMIQMRRHRQVEALASLERAAGLGGDADAEVARWTRQIRERLPELRAGAREPLP